MISLKDYIFEELDDNLFWLLDKWFERNERQAQEFIELIVKCKQDGAKVNIDNLKTYIKGTQLESNLMEFCNITRDKAISALKKSNGHLEMAIDIVLNGAENAI